MSQDRSVLQDRLDARLSDARFDVKSRAIAVADLAESLADRLTRLARTVRESPRTATINDLGELQGSGLALDMQVGKLYAARQQLALIEYLIEAAQADEA